MLEESSEINGGGVREVYFKWWERCRPHTPCTQYSVRVSFGFFFFWRRCRQRTRTTALKKCTGQGALVRANTVHRLVKLAKRGESDGKRILPTLKRQQQRQPPTCQCRADAKRQSVRGDGERRWRARMSVRIVLYCGWPGRSASLRLPISRDGPVYQPFCTIRVEAARSRVYPLFFPFFTIPPRLGTLNASCQHSRLTHFNINRYLFFNLFSLFKKIERQEATQSATRQRLLAHQEPTAGTTVTAAALSITSKHTSIVLRVNL